MHSLDRDYKQNIPDRNYALYFQTSLSNNDNIYYSQLQLSGIISPFQTKHNLMYWKIDSLEITTESMD